MGIGSAIERVKKGVKEVSLPAVKAGLREQLRSDAIPAPLRPAASRLARLLRAPRAPREAVALVAASAAPHATHTTADACPVTERGDGPLATDHPAVHDAGVDTTIAQPATVAHPEGIVHGEPVRAPIDPDSAVDPTAPDAQLSAASSAAVFTLHVAPSRGDLSERADVTSSAPHQSPERAADANETPSLRGDASTPPHAADETSPAVSVLQPATSKTPVDAEKDTQKLAGTPSAANTPARAADRPSGKRGSNAKASGKNRKKK